MRLFLSSLTTAAVASALLVPLAPAASTAERAASPRRIAYSQWDTGPEFRTGTMSGTRAVKGRLGVVKAPTGRRTYSGRSYEVGRWVSPWTESRFGLTELVASW
ncbi:MAG: hypothetical protein WCS84_04600, partial [Nocardioides sp.]